MKEPEWLLDEVVRQIHELELAEHGGIAGIRDAGLLSSALHRPRNLFVYVPDTDLAALAAVYTAGIARNHPSGRQQAHGCGRGRNVPRI